MKNARYRLRRALAAVFCALIVCACLCPAALAAQERDRKTIRVGFFAFDGYHMMDEDGNPSGYGHELLRRLSRYIDVEYEYIGYENSWDDMVDMLAAGEIDLVTSARVTPERVAQFAFSKPVGTSSAMLTTRPDNDTIRAGDYETYDGMTVGLLNGNSRNRDWANFAEENGFSYKPVYFEMPAQLEQALSEGQIDAALTSSLRLTQNERVLDYFAVEQFYVILRKEDTELLKTINYAIDQMDAVEGDWKNELNNKYYFHQEERQLAFTPAEQALLKPYTTGEKKLVVSVCTDKEPYAYTENGEAKGILIDYFAQLAAYVGLSYELIVPADRAEYQSWCESECMDLSLDGRFQSDAQAEKLGRSLTVPYTTMRLAMLTRRDFDGEIGTLAVAESQGLFGIEDGLAPGAERLRVESREEAMRAVLSGKADATFVYLYTAQQFVNQDERGLLTYTMLEEPTYEYHLSFSSHVDHAFAGIFTKAIYAMPSGTFENIASGYTSYKAKDVDFITWTKIYPIPTLLIGATILLIALLLVQVFERQKAVQKEKERSAELQKLAAMADSANHAKTIFLNNMSHDIRTPMNAIIGFTALADSHLDQPQRVREYLKKISVSSEHLLSLINDVLDMSRIESGKVTLDERPLHLPDLICDVQTIVQPTAEEKQLAFLIDTEDVRDENIIADELRLNQILLNILSNAVKFNRQGGTVSLRLRQLPDAPEGTAKYQFIIRDTGIGMKKEFIGHIFEAFSREQTASVSGIPGTGLGMTITKNLAEMMGGTIEAESEEGAGSVFTLTLSFRLGAEAAKEKRPAPLQAQSLAGRRILLVEDNQLNQEIAVTLLEEMGARVETADDGALALAKMKVARRGQYDLILMDIQMPVMDGYEAARRIRALEDGELSQTPIVAMTANAFCTDREQAMACGMNDYLTKPIHAEQLRQTLCRVLGGDRAAQ